MASNFTLNQPKKGVIASVGPLPAIGLSIGLLVFALAAASFACPQFEAQAEDYAGYFLLDRQ
jgi:hypothetical protein